MGCLAIVAVIVSCLIFGPVITAVLAVIGLVLLGLASYA
jgi:hypothetical protein